MKVQIVNKSAYPTPAYATEKSAGMDLKANITEPITLGPLERTMVPTGLFIALPDGTEAQVRPRSGLAAKFGISVLNSPGTIDADYRGPVLWAVQRALCAGSCICWTRKRVPQFSGSQALFCL